MSLLEINNLNTRFKTMDGEVAAVNDISFSMETGETLGIVGESGCGKSVHARSIMRLIPIPPGKIEKGEIWYNGRNLLKLPENEMYKIRGPEIAMVFQDPMTSLNPVQKIMEHLTETIQTHEPETSDEDAEARVEEVHHSEEVVTSEGGEVTLPATDYWLTLWYERETNTLLLQPIIID